MKASAEASPRALREVERFNENPETGGQRRRQTIPRFTVEDLNGGEGAYNCDTTVKTASPADKGTALQSP